MAYYELNPGSGIYSVRHLRFWLDYAFVLRGFGYRSPLFFSKTKCLPICQGQIHETHDSLPFRRLARCPARERLL